MAGTQRNPGREDVEQQLQTLREDFGTLAKLLRDIGEAKAGEKRDAALAEATELLEKSRSAVEEGRAKAQQATASVEDYIRNQPLQSALIALGVGFIFGMITRR